MTDSETAPIKEFPVVRTATVRSGGRIPRLFASTRQRHAGLEGFSAPAAGVDVVLSDLRFHRMPGVGRVALGMPPSRETLVVLNHGESVCLLVPPHGGAVKIIEEGPVVFGSFELELSLGEPAPVPGDHAQDLDFHPPSVEASAGEGAVPAPTYGALDQASVDALRISVREGLQEGLGPLRQMVSALESAMKAAIRVSEVMRSREAR